MFEAQQHGFRKVLSGCLQVLLGSHIRAFTSKLLCTCLVRRIWLLLVETEVSVVRICLEICLETHFHFHCVHFRTMAAHSTMVVDNAPSQWCSAESHASTSECQMWPTWQRTNLDLVVNARQGHQPNKIMEASTLAGSSYYQYSW